MPMTLALVLLYSVCLVDWNTAQTVADTAQTIADSAELGSVERFKVATVAEWEQSGRQTAGHEAFGPTNRISNCPMPPNT